MLWSEFGQPYGSQVGYAPAMEPPAEPGPGRGRPRIVSWPATMTAINAANELSRHLKATCGVASVVVLSGQQVQLHVHTDRDPRP